MAARKSKRLTLKKKARITKKVRDNFKKKNKEIVRKDKFYGKVPRGVLMTNNEIEESNKHKEEIRRINEEYLKTMESELKPVDEDMCDLIKCMNDSELFIEVCDYRDIEKSRNKEMEKSVIEKGNKLMIWINYNNGIRTNTPEIEIDGIKIFEDIAELNNIKKFVYLDIQRVVNFILKNLLKNYVRILNVRL